jgi:hypothetical protein
MEATAQIFRTFKQAPWRQQTQGLAGLSIGLLILLVVGGLYLAVASRAGNAGRDLQRLEAQKAELVLENDRLRKELADLRSMTRMASRALELGFAPAQPEQIHYVAVSEYPQAEPAAAAPPLAPAEAPARSASPLAWLRQTIDQVLGNGAGGG